MSKPLSKRTKADLENELFELKTKIEKEKSSFTPKTLEQELSQSQQIREATKELTMEHVLNQISTLRLNVSDFLNHVSEKMIQEVKSLNMVREAVQVEKTELEKLHDVEVVALSLDQLLADYEIEKRKLEEEMKIQKQKWEEERRQREVEKKEYDLSLKKLRDREKEEYEYGITKERQKQTDEWALMQNNWKVREAELKKQEEEHARLVKEVATFPKQLEESIAKALKENSQKWEEKRQTEILLAQKETENHKKIYELQVKTLEERVAKQNQEILSLREELKIANQQAQALASRAIDGASEARTLAHINKIAMEQAKHNIGKA